MNNALSNGNPQEPLQQAGVIVAEHIRDVTVHAEVLALLPDPATARLCLDIAEYAAGAIDGTMAAAHVGADPEKMIAAAEEIDLQMLREHDEGSPRERLERVTRAFEDWKQERPGRMSLLLDDCRGDLDRCVTTECHETALVVAPCHGNMDARDAFHDILFNEHKLVLVPPPGQYAGNLLGHVVIGWKPHDHAQRAVVAARRWLTAADRVTVLCVNDKPDGSYQFTARELLKQLGLDGDVIAINSGNRSVGETILDFAKAEKATCLLIGAFKHGYFLELLLGRVTRYLLSHATLPMMIKH
ncbi:universal stress protein [Rhizobium ruizarguesonis]|uniref:universal stress protein n=1 Tax=Rhizobium ruizarguesonis TaxID=2081791 RepID=UPI001031843A|nr:universal stress protein [Rhizobium ruizarguesonis]TBC89052.1 universal stress protein [Rhizobium ruizarguesonis]TBD08034.1 universal stress protein [Rhizobium ruizarguesonis]TBD24778.1 universal stress protein [Rhizobium ruizarguesonis]TBD31271.1 universal stress protein [Rhizobium ruizarguesonis]TBD33880.1 universal stress protein [Rhizobium ruizarguesonis]